MRRADLLRVVAGVALAAAIVAALLHRNAFSQASIDAGLAQSGAWAPVAFTVFYAAAAVVFLPGSVLTLAAGAVFGPVAGALYSLAGATLGAVLAFLAARHLVGDWAARKASGRLARLVEGVDAEGWRFVAFVRLVPLFPFNLVNYAFGLTRIGLGPYTTATAMCMLPGALAYAWMGHAGREAVAGADGAVRSALLALALLAFVVFLPRLARRLRPAESITPQRLRALLREGAVQVVDVRDAAAFAGEAGHLACAIHIPLGDLAARRGELEQWREGGLVLMCRTQVRSREAARLLSGHGFRGLRIAHGGMNAWREAGYQVAYGGATAATCGAREGHADRGWMPESCRACARHGRLAQPVPVLPG